MAAKICFKGKFPRRRGEIIGPQLKNPSSSTVQQRQFKRELCGCGTTAIFKISLKVAEKKAKKSNYLKYMLHLKDTSQYCWKRYLEFFWFKIVYFNFSSRVLLVIRLRHYFPYICLASVLQETK